jgi:hypothetical protein
LITSFASIRYQSTEDRGLPDTQGAVGCSQGSESISADNYSAQIWGHLFSLQDGFCSIGE